MASLAWTSLYNDTIAPWLAKSSDSAFRSTQSGSPNGGALVLFFECEDPSDPDAFALTTRPGIPQLPEPIFEWFSRHMCQRLNVTREDLERVYSTDHLAVHDPNVVSLKGLRVMLESYARTDSLYDDTPPSHIFLMPTYSRQAARQTFNGFLKDLKTKSVTGDVTVPFLHTRAQAAFFPLQETSLMLDEDYWHRVFQVNPLLLKKPDVSSMPRHAL